MKKFYPKPVKKHAAKRLLLLSIILLVVQVCTMAQTCPAPVPTTITANPNTYYPGLTATVSPGTTSITLGAAASGAGYDNTPISTGDLVLIIQMQGATINSNNSSDYGKGVLGGYGNGYLTSPATDFLAGNMEYAVANNNVPLSGGTLNLVAGVTNNYRNADYDGISGQYRYQVIRVGTYYNLVLGANFAVGAWNGTTGGVFVVYVTNDLNLSSKTINASNAGFRGGGGRQLTGGIGARTDYVTLASNAANGSKGEGIAGTPQYMLGPGTSFNTLTNTGIEGYPNGSYAQGAPGNAGGGGTDGNAGANDQNSGGGGGGNGGPGGKGGKSWSSAVPTGGEPAANFAEVTPSRMVLGGGGGAGTTNDGTGTPGAGLSSSGAPGGGMVIINTRSLSGTGTIIANGKSGNTSTLNDASGGGGAGGSVLINAQSGAANLTVQAKGGNGGSNSGACSGCSNAQGHGPGGGGGGGVVYCTTTLNAASTVAPGVAGTTKDPTTTNFGALAGTIGILTNNVPSSQLPTIPMTCFILPSSFLSLSATHNNKDIKVKWQVTNESEAREYIVGRSTDGNNFTEIGTKAATGISRYEYPDVAGNSDTVLYYRIEKISLNGSHEYSKLVVVNLGSSLTEDLSVIPNPFSSSATIRFTSFARASVIMKLLSVNGAVLWQKQYMAVQGINTFRLDNVINIPEGIYMLQLNNGVQVQTIKVMIRH